MMKRFFRIGLAGILLILTLIPALAQNQPARTTTQPAVLNALSERVGVPGLGLGSLVSWNWFFGTYEFVVSQGCLGAPAAAPGGNAAGWQRYVLNYKGTEYVYLISDDAANLLLCNEAALSTPVPSVTPPTAAQPTPTLPPAVPPTITPPPLVMMTSTPAPTTSESENPQGSCPLPERLSAGIARVLPGDPQWIHSGGVRSSPKIGEINPGQLVRVIGGPTCDVSSGMNYYQIEFGIDGGWTSEGLDGVYWLEPMVIEPLFLVPNAARTIPASWISQNFPAGFKDVVFSRDAAIAAVLENDGAISVLDYVAGVVLW
jgi:hypothetical protein